MRQLELVLAVLCFAGSLIMPLLARTDRLWAAIAFLSMAFLLLWRATVESMPRISDVSFLIGSAMLVPQLVRMAIMGYRKAVSQAH